MDGVLAFGIEGIDYLIRKEDEKNFSITKMNGSAVLSEYRLKKIKGKIICSCPSGIHRG